MDDDEGEETRKTEKARNSCAMRVLLLNTEDASAREPGLRAKLVL